MVKVHKMSEEGKKEIGKKSTGLKVFHRNGREYVGVKSHKNKT